MTAKAGTLLHHAEWRSVCAKGQKLFDNLLTKATLGLRASPQRFYDILLLSDMVERVQEKFLIVSTPNAA